LVKELGIVVSTVELAKGRGTVDLVVGWVNGHGIVGLLEE
jgi:hypothetical protein